MAKGNNKGSVKTNAMRMLDKLKISYEVITYECDEFIDGCHIADMLKEDYSTCFKTLVTTGKAGEHYVYVLPVDKEIDLKAAARVAGEKSVEMLAVKDINSVTGYIRGTTTSLGMKKQYKTFIAKSASELEFMIISGGAAGLQIKLKPEDLLKAVRGSFDEFIRTN